MREKAFDVEAVALVVFSPEGRILVVRELKSKPEYGKWAGMITFPIETINDGESNKDALARLAWEEIGVDISCLKECIFRGEKSFKFFSGKRSKVYVYSVKCTVEFEATPEDGEDVEFFSWMHPEELKMLDEIKRRKEIIPILEQFV